MSEPNKGKGRVMTDNRVCTTKMDKILLKSCFTHVKPTHCN